MAKVIEFYTPTGYKKKVRVLPPEERGMLIEMYPAHSTASCPEQPFHAQWNVSPELLGRFADCLNEMRSV